MLLRDRAWRNHPGTALQGGAEVRQTDRLTPLHERLPRAGKPTARAGSPYWGRRGRNGKIITLIAQMERVYSPPHFLILVV